MSMTSTVPASATRTCDFDLHGVVGVRILAATDADHATVRRQLGPLERELDREPDITIRFVDHLETGLLTHVGVGETAFDDDSFYVVRGRHGATASARMPLGDVGTGIEILCERAMPAVPHLVALVNLAALGRGVLPLHASAFARESLGVLVTGWAKGGKTESLLGSVAHGASYVADEWVYLTPDRRMFGVPEPIRLWAWQLEQLPQVLRARPRTEQARLKGWQSVAGLTAAFGGSDRLPGSTLARRGSPILGRQACLQIPPAELFGDDQVQPEANLDAVVLVLSHDDPDVTVAAAAPTEVAGRMRASLSDERAPFLAHYRQFQFAFPGRSSALVEAASDLEARLLAELFDGRPAAVVRHPYPCDLRTLADAVWSAARGTFGVRSVEEVRAR